MEHNENLLLSYESNGFPIQLLSEVIEVVATGTNVLVNITTSHIYWLLVNPGLNK